MTKTLEETLEDFEKKMVEVKRIASALDVVNDDPNGNAFKEFACDFIRKSIAEVYEKKMRFEQIR